MKPLKMRYVGDPVLVTKAKEIPEITDEIRELSAEMIQTMYRNNGCGLAGNQIGKALRIAVIHVDPPEDKDGNPLPMETPGERELCPKMPITLINQSGNCGIFRRTMHLRRRLSQRPQIVCKCCPE